MQRNPNFAGAGDQRDEVDADEARSPDSRLEDPAAGVVSISAAPKSLHGTPLPAGVPYTQQWSFDVQQKLGRSFVLDAGYHGSKATHLLGIVDMNEVPAGLGVATGLLKGAATTATASGK